MRSLDLRIALGTLFFFVSCAHDRPVDRPPTREGVAAYRAVRAGEQPMTRADGIEFCAADDGVEAIRTDSRTTDDWADKFRDADLRDEVRTLMVRDPSLAQLALTVRVDQGEAIIDGAVPRDDAAVAAARDALAVPGVLAARVRTASAGASAHPLVAVACQ